LFSKPPLLLCILTFSWQNILGGYWLYRSELVTFRDYVYVWTGRI
jgi:hypothetical protein